ncbi:hypothetical protein CC85DRAFT_322467, partial [Cutaneotrichosporon oleaginosum]
WLTPRQPACVLQCERLSASGETGVAGVPISLTRGRSLEQHISQHLCRLWAYVVSTQQLVHRRTRLTQMLTSLIAATALAASVGAAPTERQVWWPGLPDDAPWYRVTCYTSSRCPQTDSGSAYRLDVNNTLTTACTQLPPSMRSCRLERFPIEGGVPEENGCTLSLYWRHRDGQCQNKVMDLNPLVWQWGWTCGSVWGSSIQGYSVDCSQPAPGGMSRFAAPEIQKGENAEAEYGIGGQ